MSTRPAEVPLHGGNMSSGVVRVGDTVRRPAGPWTPAVHALLAHLHDVGFAGAPRPLGIDERGREVLTFIPGDVVWPDHFALLDPQVQLERVARLVRAFHDAVAGFVPPPGAVWQRLIPPDGAEIIAHHDLAPWNLVAGTEGWAFIDWDTAAPGTRLWDLAYALHGFVPLSADPRLQRADAAARVRAFVDAYGLGEADRRPLLELLGRAPSRCTIPRRGGRRRRAAVGAPVGGGSRRGLAGRRRAHRGAPPAVGGRAPRLSYQWAVTA